MKEFLSRFNWTAIISGLFAGLFVTILLEFVIGYPAIVLTPIISGIVSVYLANNHNLKDGLITGFLSIFIVGIFLLPAGFLGILINLLGLLGGLIGFILNETIFKGSNADDSEINLPRTQFIKDKLNSTTKGNRSITIIGTVFLGMILVIGVISAGHAPSSTADSTPKTVESAPVVNTTNTTPTPAPATTVPDNSVDKNLENKVKKGLESFFKDFNSMYSENGVTKGYLIKTITIDDINKVSDSEVEVTVSLKRIASNGDEFDSTWSGSLYLKNGKWVDDGDFVQTYSYNKNTGQRTL